jgi:hypothetical protein
MAVHSADSVNMLVSRNGFPTLDGVKLYLQTV